MSPLPIAMVVAAAVASAVRVIDRRTRRLMHAPCAVCIGVSTTWLGILIGIHAGWLGDPRWTIIAAVFMGGSAAGVAEQLAARALMVRRLRVKAIALVVGFPLAYAAPRDPIVAAAALVVMVAVACVLARAPRVDPNRNASATVARELEQCC